MPPPRDSCSPDSEDFGEFFLGISRELEGTLRLKFVFCQEFISAVQFSQSNESSCNKLNCKLCNS